MNGRDSILINQDKTVLMIHHLTMEKVSFLQANYNKYSELTFDDALLSQFYFAPLLKDLPIEKTIFVSPGLLNENVDDVRNQYPENQPIMRNESVSMRSGESSLYMSEREIRILHNEFGYTIGAHSYNHAFVYLGKKHFSKPIIDFKFMFDDSRLMMEWIQKNNYSKKFCFPFNQRNDQYVKCLETIGFEKLYGIERIDLEDEMLSCL